MNRPTLPILLFIAFAIAVLLVELKSAVPQLWLASLAAFLFALIVLGWQKATPVMVWLIAINMVSIWADLFNVDLAEQGLGLYPVVRNQKEAILYSSAAMGILALGMFVGQQILKGTRDGGQTGNTADVLAHSPSRIALLYFTFLPVAKIVSLVGNFSSGLSQPAFAFGLLKFAFIYWLSITVFATRRGYTWLVAVISTELVVGSMGGFSNYKEGFFVILIALAESKRRLPMRQVVFALAGSMLIIYMSLVWTVVKVEFRTHIIGAGAVNSVTWLASKYASPELATRPEAISKLLARIGYTQFYALVLSRDTTQFGGIYARAVEHVLKPRLLFPDKAALDDSAETTQILHWKIPKGTSIGLGYVAQAHIDFGFPGLLLPIFCLGTIVGAIYKYFLTRPAPEFLCEAFGVACIFNSLRFESNIDKEVGGLLMGFLVLAITLHFGKAFLLRVTAAKEQLRNTCTFLEGSFARHQSR